MVSQTKKYVYLVSADNGYVSIGMYLSVLGGFCTKLKLWQVVGCHIYGTGLLLKGGLASLLDFLCMEEAIAV